MKPVKNIENPPEQWKNNSDCLEYIGDDDITQLCGDHKHIINHYKDPY